MAVVLNVTKVERARNFLRNMVFHRLRWNGKKVVVFDDRGRKYEKDDFLSGGGIREELCNLECHLKRTRPFKTSLSDPDPTRRKWITFARTLD